MATDQERLVVMLEARVSEFEKRMKKAESTGTRSYQGLRRNSSSATRQMERDMMRSTSRINQALATTTTRIGAMGKAFAGGLLGGAVGALALNNLQRNIRSTVSDLSNLAKVADRVDINVEAFQGLRRGFELSGVAADSLNGSLQEFGKRVGQAENGTGRLATVVNRYGISLTDTQGKMRSQLDLLKEVAETIRGAGSAQERLAIANSAFGSSGVAMVNAMQNGAAGIDDMIRSAQEAGFVVDESLIRKAEDLDDRFADLQRRTSTWFKVFAVEVADAGARFAGLKTTIDDIFDGPDQMRSMLGDEIADALLGSLPAVERTQDELRELRAAFLSISDAAQDMQPDLQVFAQQLERIGQDAEADVLRQLSAEMDGLLDQFQSGQIDADEFASRMGSLEGRVRTLTTSLQGVNAIGFDGVISRLGVLASAIADVVARGQELRNVAGVAAGVDVSPSSGLRARHTAEADSMRAYESQKRAMTEFLAAEDERNRKTADRLELEREIERVIKRAGEEGVTLTQAQAEQTAAAAIAANNARRADARSAAGGKGGGAAKTDKETDFERATKSIRDQTAALEAEAVALVAAAASGQEYGQAIEFARRKAELLTAAQQSGLTVTPELEAAIDRLAQGYVSAGQAAADAADRMREAQENAERGADAMADMFMSILDGSKSAKEALADLLMQMARVQMQKAFLGLAQGGGGGFLGAIGGLLGGARANGGAVSAGTPYLVNENTPNSEVFVPSQNGGILNVQQAQAALRGGQGGGEASGGTSRVEVSLSQDLVGRIMEETQGQTVKIVQQGLNQGFKAYDQTLRQKVIHHVGNPRG